MSINKRDFEAWLWHMRSYDLMNRNDVQAAVTDILSPEWTLDAEDRAKQLMNAYGIESPEVYFSSMEHKQDRANYDRVIAK